MAFREDPFMDDEFALPPLPATPLYNPNACQVVAHHGGSELRLDAESTGIPESRFRTMFNFESNTQILCASRESAMMTTTTAATATAMAMATAKVTGTAKAMVVALAQQQRQQPQHTTIN
jgi:hypothetical protein